MSIRNCQLWKGKIPVAATASSTKPSLSQKTPNGQDICLGHRVSITQKVKLLMRNQSFLLTKVLLYITHLHFEHWKIKIFQRHCSDATSTTLNSCTDFWFIMNSARCVMPSDEHMYEIIKRGHLSILTEIVERGYDVNKMCSLRNINSLTLLHMAVQCEQYKIAKYLVRNGAKVSIPNSIGMTAIWDAIRRRNETIAKILLTSTPGRKVMRDHFNYAVRKLCPLIVELIMKKNPQINLDRFDAMGLTTLHHAVQSDKVCDHCAPETSDIDPIKARSAIVKMLLAAGAVDCESKYSGRGLPNGYAFHFAAARGYVKIVKTFLEHGADVNVRATTGTTPLIEAATNGNLRIVKILLRKSADVHLRLKNGKAAIHLACQYGHADIVSYLHRYGCDLNARDSEKSTPLHLASYHDRARVVQKLLELGADVNATNNSGETALHIAARHSWSDVTKALLENGAHTNVRCRKSKLPIDYAVFQASHHLHQREIGGDQCDVYCYFTPCNRSCREEVLANLQKYELEAQRMMSERIGDSGVTLHHIRTHNLYKRVIYARRECIVNTIKSEKFRSEFPLYCGYIGRRLEEGQKKNDMLLPALESLGVLTGNMFSTEIGLMFLNYLTNEEMECLIKSVVPEAQ